MKMIMAVFRPEKLQDAKDALVAVGVNGLTITRVTGHGEEGGMVFTTRVGAFRVDELEKVKIETVVYDALVPAAIAAIQKSVCTGRMGDGRIFVLPVEASYRIRTGTLEPERPAAPVQTAEPAADRPADDGVGQ